MRIAVISRLVPRANFQSGDRRLIALMEILGRRHEVHFLGYLYSTPEDVSACDALRRMGITVHEKGWEGLVAATFRRAFDVAVFEFFDTFEMWGPEFRRRQPGAALILDSVDVHFAREGAAAAIGLVDVDRVAETRRRELAAYRAVNAVIAVTDEDADLLRREDGMPPIFVIPNIVPLRARVRRRRTPNALFIGSFHHAPNVDAVGWFVTEVWPRVRSAVADATASIVGVEMPSSLRALCDTPGVHVLGYVYDTGPCLDDAALSIAPLRYGAGMKGKVNEALAAGLPIVSTGFGVQGLPIVNGVHAVVADDAESFAQAMVRMFNEPDAAETIGRAGQALAGRFSPEQVERLISSMCDSIVAGRSRLRGRVVWMLAQFHVAGEAVIRRLRQAAPL